jgi:hypothetical protein
VIARQLGTDGTQPGERVTGLALDRPDRAPEQVSGGYLSPVLTEPQHQHGPLPGREPPQRLFQNQPDLRVGIGSGDLRGLLAQPLGRTAAQPAPPRDGLGVENPPHVRLSVVDPLPPGRRPRQRRLQQILRIMPVARQQIGSSAKRARTGPNELLE